MKRLKKKQNNANRNKKALTFFLLGVIAGLLAVIVILLPRNLPENTSVKIPPEKAAGDYEKGIFPEKSRTEEKKSERTASLTAVVKKPGRVAIIIDDAGNDLAALKAFLVFPGKLTIAVLPQLSASGKASELIKAAGKEVMLHLPMQPVGNENPGPGAINVTMSREEIVSALEKDLKTVPDARGINNHMGSLATQDKYVMETVFSYLQNAKLYFVDSKTNSVTVTEQIARQYEIPWLERNSFLDTTPKREAILQALERGIGFSRQNGSAVLIGHVQNYGVLEVLTEKYEELVASGIEFVFVSELFEKSIGEGR